MARAELGKHVGHFTLAPAELDGSPNYVCQGDWNLLGTLEVEGTFGWLRGVDLNHRPLGYECKEERSFKELRGQGRASKY